MISSIILSAMMAFIIFFFVILMNNFAPAAVLYGLFLLFLFVRMTFAGSFPNYGFAFTDANGDEYMYALYLSGMDGSVGIEPIK